MGNQYNVQVHQAGSAASSYSYSSAGSYASSGSSTPRSVSSGSHREYGATKHSSQVSRSGNNVVINHHKRDHENDSPSPRYGGVYH